MLGIACPKQGQALSGSPIPKHWSSNLPPPPLRVITVSQFLVSYQILKLQ